MQNDFASSIALTAGNNLFDVLFTSFFWFFSRFGTTFIREKLWRIVRCFQGFLSSHLQTSKSGTFTIGLLFLLLCLNLQQLWLVSSQPHSGLAQRRWVLLAGRKILFFRELFLDMKILLSSCRQNPCQLLVGNGEIQIWLLVHLLYLLCFCWLLLECSLLFLW